MMYRITPKPGVPIRDPVTLNLIPPAGFVAERVTAYWRRRASEGGVEVREEPTATITELLDGGTATKAVARAGLTSVSNATGAAKPDQKE